MAVLDAILGETYGGLQKGEARGKSVDAAPTLTSCLLRVRGKDRQEKMKEWLFLGKRSVGVDLILLPYPSASPVAH